MRRTAFAVILTAVLLAGAATAWAGTQITILNVSLSECAKWADDLCGTGQWLIGYNFKDRTCAIACTGEEPPRPLPLPKM
ncbi:MAG TPA: hypothetical protein VLV83_14015 [Acidobacteriota bacterium]|nr:hypothetical protein [Acidobacteriota bacterium]